MHRLFHLAKFLLAVFPPIMDRLSSVMPIAHLCSFPPLKDKLNNHLWRMFLFNRCLAPEIAFIVRGFIKTYPIVVKPS